MSNSGETPGGRDQQSCDICGKPIRKDNQAGVCSRSRACRAENARRRYVPRPRKPASRRSRADGARRARKAGVAYRPSEGELESAPEIVGQFKAKFGRTGGGD